MSEGTFAVWLLAQAYRGGPIGDIAREMRFAGRYLEGRTYEECRRHMLSVNAPTSALRALALAKQEWDSL